MTPQELDLVKVRAQRGDWLQRQIRECEQSAADIDAVLEERSATRAAGKEVHAALAVYFSKYGSPRYPPLGDLEDAALDAIRELLVERLNACVYEFSNL
jgi:hypothetical protein